MVHLCEWLTLRQVSSGGNNGKDKFKKKELRKNEKRIKKRNKIKKVRRGIDGREGEREEREREIFCFLRFSLRSTKIGP